MEGWMPNLPLFQPSTLPMDRVRKGERPWTTLDALHRESLESLIGSLGIGGLRAEDLDELAGAWCRLRPWA
jgi:2-haloacid dehalogenase